MSIKKLEWDDSYSVGVAELDEHHKKMFGAINELLEAIGTNTPKEHLGDIINTLLEYKKFHFATEERYFDEFNYDGAKEHKEEHKKFNDNLTKIKNKYQDYNIEFAFELIDFLEDWLLDHLMNMDQKYKKCFAEHGLK